MLRTKEGELSYPIVIIKSKTEISDNTITSLDTFGHVEPRN